MRLLFKLRERRIIGLDIDETGVFATELIKKQKTICLIKSVKADSLKELIKKEPSFKETAAIINLPSQVTLFRSFRLASSFLNRKNKQKDILAFLSRQNLPFKLEDCFWDIFILNSHLNLVAAKKEVVEKYIAQTEESGLSVAAVTADLVALYNILIHTYPGREEDRFGLLNIRETCSDLLVYEAKRLSFYPLPLGIQGFNGSPESLEKFSMEIHRSLNTHYLQNSSVTEKNLRYFYLSGQGTALEGVVPTLKKALTEFEIIVLSALKNIGILSKEPLPHQEVMSLSLGLALTYLGIPSGLKINLISAKIKKERQLAFLKIMKKVSFFFVIFCAACLFFWNIKLIKGLKDGSSIYKNNQIQLSSMLPKVKVLKEEKKNLKKLQDFLESKLSTQRLYLKTLAVIAKTKAPFITIKELDLQVKENGLEVFLSGSAPGYQQINDFLIALKKDEKIRDPKVVASVFETKANEINFKLRFEVVSDSKK